MKGLKRLIILLLAAGCIYWLFSDGIYNILRYFYPLSYYETIEGCAVEYGLDEYLIRSVIKAESGYDERASSGKAHGLMQLTDETALWIAEKTGLSYEKRLESETNIKMGCYYLSYLSEKFKDRKTILAAYNAGHTKVSKWLGDSRYSSDGKTLDAIPYAETAAYVKKVEKYYIVYKRLYNNT